MEAMLKMKKLSSRSAQPTESPNERCAAQITDVVKKLGGSRRRSESKGIDAIGRVRARSVQETP